MSKITKEDFIQLLKIGSTSILPPIEIDITKSVIQLLDDDAIELIKCAHSTCKGNPDFKLRVVLQFKKSGDKIIMSLEVKDRDICDSGCRIFRNNKLK